MPNPTSPDVLDAAFRTAGDWMADAPGGNTSLDDLFPDPNQPTTANPQTNPDGQPPAEPAQPDFFLKAGDSVYKSREDAIKGVQHKDELIARLRQEAIAATGVDPITKQRVPQQTSPQTTAAPSSYFDNPQKYLDDLVAAGTKQDARGYLEANARVVDERIAPFVPIVSELAKQTAINSVSRELKGFESFYGSEDYTATLEAEPQLKEAIELAEADPRFYNRLAGLYRLTYKASMGTKLPQVLAQPPVAQPVQPVRRPTAAQTTLTPPTAQPTAQPSLGTSEGRKALIQRFEQGGGLDRQF